jgi:group I intron endonuclease
MKDTFTSAFKLENVKELNYRGSCIYIIQSPSFKYYIGKTVDFYKRIIRYRKNTSKSQRRLYYSLNKYGFENHNISILFKCEKSYLNLWEKFFIEFFDTFQSEHGLNLQVGGGGGRCSDESTDIIREKAKGRKFSLKHRENIGLAKKGKPTSLKGVPKSKEATQKRVETFKKRYALGEIKIWNKGVPRTDEEKRKMSLAKLGKPSKNKGRIVSDETREKLRQANLGKKQSEETKQKKREISLKNGYRPPQRIWTEADRKRWSEMNLGEKNGNYKHGRFVNKG